MYAAGKSERELRDVLTEAFFSRQHICPSILLIQCDTMSNPSSMIDHVQFICEDLYRQRLRWGVGALSVEERGAFLASSALPCSMQDLSSVVPVVPLHVVLLVHDSSSTRGSAHEALHLQTFHPLWRAYFCDDIRPVGEETEREVGRTSGFSTKCLLQQSTLELAEHNAAYVKHKLLPLRYRDALFSIRFSDRHPLAAAPVRLKLMESLMADEVFVALLYDGVLLVMAALDQHTSHLRGLENGVNASVRQSLMFTFDEAVVRALAVFFVLLDRNCNLALLDPSHPGAALCRVQWFGMVLTPGDGTNSFRPQLSQSARDHFTALCLSRRCHINEDGSVDTINDGGRAVDMQCRVPFSYRLVDFLSSSDLQQAIEDTAGYGREYIEAQALCVLSKLSLAFGDTLVSSVHPTNLLLDWIDMQLADLGVATPRADLYCAIEGLMLCFDGRYLTSVAFMPPTLWASTRTIRAVVEILDILRRCGRKGGPSDDLYHSIIEYCETKRTSGKAVPRHSPSADILQIVTGFFMSLPPKDTSAISLLPLIRTALDDLQLESGSSSLGLRDHRESCAPSDALLLLPVITSEAARHFPEHVDLVYRAVVNLDLSGGLLSRHSLLALCGCIDGALLGVREALLVSIPTVVESVLRRVLVTIIFPSLRTFLSDAQGDCMSEGGEGAGAALDLVHFLAELCCVGVDVLHKGGAPVEGESFRHLQRLVVQFLLSSDISMRILEQRVLHELRQRCESDECAVCLEGPMVDPVVTSCRHTYCRRCIVQVQQEQENPACPLCRTVFTIRGPAGSHGTLMETTVLLLQWHADVVGLEGIDGVAHILDDPQRLFRLLQQPILTSILEFGMLSTCRVLALVQVEVQGFVQRVARHLSEQSDASVSPPPDATGASPDERVVSALSSEQCRWTHLYALRTLYHRHGKPVFTALLMQPDTRLPLPWLTAFSQRAVLQNLFPPQNVPSLDPFFLEGSYRANRAALASSSSIGAKFDILCSREAPPLSAARSVLIMHATRAAVVAYCSKDWNGTTPPQVAELHSALKRPATGVLAALQGRQSFWSRLGDSPSENAIRLFEQHLLGFVLSPQVQSVPWFGSLTKSSKYANVLMCQVVLHVAACASAGSPYGWLYVLLTDPQELNGTFVPSMPEDDVAMILRGLDRKTATRAYMCRCTAIYFIGNCGRPDEVGSCPKCGRPLGGRNHELVDTSRALEEEELMQRRTQSGYLPCSDTWVNGRGCSPIAVGVLRLVEHAALLLSALVASVWIGSNSRTTRGFAQALLTSTQQFLRGVQGRQSVASTADALRGWAQERFLQEWTQLRTYLSLPDDGLAMLLHSMLSESTASFAVPAASLCTEEGRVRWEKAFQREVVEPLVGGGGVAERVDRITDYARREQQVAASAGGLDEREVMHMLAQLPVTSSDDAPLRNAGELYSLESVVWSFRSRISVEDFKHQFYLSQSNRQQFPLIATVLERESALSSMDALVHVFQWHALLLEVFEQGELTRGAAQTLTNIDAVHRLPEERRSAGREVLRAFIVAFNATFPNVENLFECQVNHLRHSLRMTEDTPLVFSLPAKALPGGEGGEGLCTIAVVEMLQSRQNEIMELLETVGVARAHSKTSDGEWADPPASAISQFTPVRTLRRLLCLYSPQEHLMPLLYSYAVQGLGFGEGRDVSFDYERIEEALAALLSLGKQKILLRLRLYAYAGEVHSSGTPVIV